MRTLFAASDMIRAWNNGETHASPFKSNPQLDPIPDSMAKALTEKEFDHIMPANPSPTAPARKRARSISPRQAEKNARVREALLKAAFKVVGKVGYARAAIAKIAETAGVSTGTFYLHFASREELFDELLPWANKALSEFIAKRVGEERCYMEFEERNIRGFFEYVSRAREFITVLMEAQVVAPRAWSAYVETREAAYLVLLDAAWERGEFPDYAREDLPQLGMMLIALRRDVVLRYFSRPARERGSPEPIIATYLTFVFGALHRSNAAAIRTLWTPPEP